MSEMIDKGYTDDQIRRTKDLFDMLPLERKYINGAWVFFTRWGKKVEEGVINSILSIMYGSYI